MPLYNDEDHVSTAIDSCLAQTLVDVEVIVVDDASTDSTAHVVERYASTDPRVRLVRQEQNQSAFQARRRGIEAASAGHVLFLDGDDELDPRAAELSLALAIEHAADVVAFGCDVVKPDGTTGGGFERGMQPKHSQLVGPEILEALFPIGKVAQGQLWRYLFDRTLLTRAYGALDAEMIIPRANDIPIAFLALMYARKYVSTPEHLYRYYFRRGASGHQITTSDEYRFIASAINSIESVSTAVTTESSLRANGSGLLATYESAWRSIVGRVLEYVQEISDSRLKAEALNLLTDRVGRVSLVLAAADFSQRSLPALRESASVPTLRDRAPQHILIRATNLGTGGAQGVVVSQARHLAESGLRVTIGIDAVPDTHFQLPDGVHVVQFTGASLAQRVSEFGDYCSDENVDVVIDHYVFYNERWPYYALVAAALGAPTIGWLHNFALRPFIDGTNRLDFLEKNLTILVGTIVLSETDATYWRLRGISNVMYLPNPPSPLLEHLPPRSTPHRAPEGTINVVWWGRLQQATKQVRELVEVARELTALEIDYHLTIIGPDGNDLKASQLQELAASHGIGEKITLAGGLHGDQLAEAIADAHVFVSTSVIEGYPLVFTEAQALGLPVVAYELPWLAILPGNDGIIQVQSGNQRAAAQAIANLASDPAYYAATSHASLMAAAAALSHDFDAMYVQLVHGELFDVTPAETDEAHVRILLRMHAEFYSRYVRTQSRALRRARAETSTLKANLVNSRKELERLTRELDDAKFTERYSAKKRLASLKPSNPRTGLRAFFQKVLPPSMYQASYYARQQHRISQEVLASVTETQAALNSKLSSVEALLIERNRERESSIGK